MEKKFQYTLKDYLEESTSATKKTITVTVKIPEFDTESLFNKYTVQYNIPPWELENFREELTRFVESQTLEYYDNLTREAVNNFLENEESQTQEISNFWAQFYSKDLEHDKANHFLSDEHIFADAYSYLIISPYLETMLQIEYEHLINIKDLLSKRDNELTNLHNYYQKEMDEALNNTSKNDSGYISSLANKHSEDIHILQSSWDSKISCVKNLQKKELREWIMKVYEDDVLKKGSSSVCHSKDKEEESAKNIDVLLPPTINSPTSHDSLNKENPPTINFAKTAPTKSILKGIPKRFPKSLNTNPSTNILSNLLKSMNPFSPISDNNNYKYPFIGENSINSTHNKLTSGHSGNSCNSRDVLQEESYTVNLGCQLKSTYNLRLVKCNLLPHFCDFDESFSDSPSTSSYLINQQIGIESKFNEFIRLNPNKLQTLLTLYTDRLQAIIIIEDGRLDLTVPGILNDFSKICEKSTEYHFPDIDRQVENIKKSIIIHHPTTAEINENTQTGNPSEIYGGIPNETKDHLEEEHYLEEFSTGDVYLTRHSNLSRTHVVFHLCITDPDEWKWLKSGTDTSVRSHTAIFEGLRNIIKTCFSLYDVQCITIPLFLAHELTEEMTLNWCLRRAELVFKCVKGYVIESQSSTTGTNFSSNSGVNLLNNTFLDHQTFLTRYSLGGGDDEEGAALLRQQHQISDNITNYNRCKIVQFQLPANLSDSGFDHVANMLPNIFRLPTPIIG